MTLWKVFSVVLSASIVARYLWWIAEMTGWVFDWCPWPAIPGEWQFLACGCGAFFTAETMFSILRRKVDTTNDHA